jgi:hypothetical protein
MCHEVSRTQCRLHQRSVNFAKTSKEIRRFSLKWQWRLKTTFWLDVALLFSVCVLQTVRFTGLVLYALSRDVVWQRLRSSALQY